MLTPMVWIFNILLYVCHEQSKNTTMKKYIPHTFVAITSFIGAVSVQPEQCGFFLVLSIAGLLYIYRDEIEKHLRR